MKVMKEQVVLKNINDFENKSLLIVDDDNPFRERLARAMEKKGFEVTQAESVQKGVDSVKAKKPGFAVVDLRLGDGNGLEVVKEIQNSNNESRIIMLTGYGNIPTAVAAIKEGAIDYLAKPADAEDVEKALPEAVYTAYEDGEEVLALKYNRITSVLVEAMKEQQEQIESLKSEIANLKGEKNGN